MFRSIQWTLQLWHASLLTVVLVVFGTVSFIGIRHMRYQEVDAELRQSAQTLMTTMRPMRPGPGGPRGEGRGGGGPPPDFRDGRGDRGGFRGEDGFRGGGGGRRGGGPPDRFDGGPDAPFPFTPEIEIPAQFVQQFGDESDSATYFVIWDSTGQVIRTSRNPDAEPIFLSQLAMVQQVPAPPSVPRIRQRGAMREAFGYGPFNTRVLVGRSIAREQAQLRNRAWLLAAVGAGVLVVGLAGGWMVSRRAIKPIIAITNAAQEISATNLSQRIDVAEAHSELGTLAKVLNDTFGRLDAAFQQQVRFTADASHELRTPLSVIHTNVQLALSRPRSAEEYRKTIETCMRASKRMKGLVDSLLLLARADAGRLTLEKQRFDLRDIVEESVAMASSLAAEKQVQIRSELQSVELDADPTRISQVVMNLLTNAIRYNREQGQVSIALRPEGNEAMLGVSDTGVGIPPEHQPHLFERFYRVDDARNRDDGGSGLGLAICKTIIDAHGGSIRVESEVGKGTTFVIRLPRAPEP
jgi:heavy metal sensor kinase